MGGVSIRRDFNSYVESRIGLTQKSITAGGAGDGVYQDDLSIVIDRQAVRNPLSVSVAVPMFPTLAAGETVEVKVKIQHCDTADGSFVDYLESVATEYTDSDSAVRQVLQIGFDLSGAKRFVKTLVKVTHSAADTDVTVFSALNVFEKGREL